MDVPLIEFVGNNLLISCSFDYTAIKANADQAILDNPASMQAEINKIHRTGISQMIICLQNSLAAIAASEQDTVAAKAERQSKIDLIKADVPTGNAATELNK